MSLSLCMVWACLSLQQLEMGSLDAALEYVRVDPKGRLLDVAGRWKKTVVPVATSVYVYMGHMCRAVCSTTPACGHGCSGLPL